MQTVDFLAIGLRHLSHEDQERLALFLERRVSWDYAKHIPVYVKSVWECRLATWMPRYTSLMEEFDGRPGDNEVLYTIRMIGAEFMGEYENVPGTLDRQALYRIQKADAIASPYERLI